MFIKLTEFHSAEENTFNSDDFRRIQKTSVKVEKMSGTALREIVCITFRDGGEILFDENYDELIKQLGV